jgi:hypothetical protein
MNLKDIKKGIKAASLSTVVEGRKDLEDYLLKEKMIKVSVNKVRLLFNPNIKDYGKSEEEILRYKKDLELWEQHKLYRDIKFVYLTKKGKLLNLFFNLFSLSGMLKLVLLLSGIATLLYFIYEFFFFLGNFSWYFWAILFLFFLIPWVLLDTSEDESGDPEIFLGINIGGITFFRKNRRDKK